MYWRELEKRSPQLKEEERLRKVMEFRRFILGLCWKGERKVVAAGTIFVCIGGKVVHAMIDHYWDRTYGNWRRGVKPLVITSVDSEKQDVFVSIGDSGWGLQPGQVVSIVRDCYVIAKARVLRRDGIWGIGRAEARILEQTCRPAVGDRVVLSLEDSMFMSYHTEQIPVKTDSP
jgi:hypothetical protein